VNLLNDKLRVVKNQKKLLLGSVEEIDDAICNASDDELISKLFALKDEYTDKIEKLTEIELDLVEKLEDS
jgi:hypothetical protein